MLRCRQRRISCFLSLITLYASESLSCRACFPIPINPMDAHHRSPDILHSSFLWVLVTSHDGVCSFPRMPHLLSRVEWIYFANRAMVSSNPDCTPCTPSRKLDGPTGLGRNEICFVPPHVGGLLLFRFSQQAKSTPSKDPNERWQSSSSPKPMATASSAAFRSSFAASFLSLSGSRSAILLKTLSSRRCSWLLIARLGRG
jgi:hypothetical protein